MRTWLSFSLCAVSLLLAACGPVPSVGSIAAIIPVGAAPAAGVAAESSAVWVPSDLDGSISRVDPATNSVSATIQPGDARSCSLCLGAVAMQSGSVWVTSSSARLALVGIDRRSNRVSSSTPLPIFPSSVIADGDGSLWLA
jgi:virginiamycin B lyase